MRITPEMLMKLAQDTVAQRVRVDRSVVGIYLYGSVLTSEPLLGGTTDIDLFIVHNDEPETEREIIRITDEVHLDIAHISQRSYRKVRDLRLHPWYGPTLFGCKILYDPQHFLDFVQASVRGQFDRPDHVMERVRPLVEEARQVWLSFSLKGLGPDLQNATLYLRALEKAAQAVALLKGPALTERRFLMQFAQRTETLQRPGLYAGLLGLLHGTIAVDTEILGGWIANWREAFAQVGRDHPSAAYMESRLGYFRRAFEALVAGETPLNVLWPLISNWTQLVEMLPTDWAGIRHWREAMAYLGLVGEAFPERLAALDAYLDNVEEFLDEWARENGA